MGPPYKRRRFNDGTRTPSSEPSTANANSLASTRRRRMTRTTSASAVADDAPVDIPVDIPADNHNTDTNSPSSGRAEPASPRLQRRKAAPEPAAVTATPAAAPAIDVKAEPRSGGGNEVPAQQPPAQVRRSGRPRKPRFDPHRFLMETDEEEEEEDSSPSDEQSQHLDAVAVKVNPRRRPGPKARLQHEDGHTTAGTHGGRNSRYPKDAAAPTSEADTLAATGRRSQRSANLRQHEPRKSQPVWTPRPLSRQAGSPSAPNADMHSKPFGSSQAFLTLPPHLAKTLDSLDQLPLPPAFPCPEKLSTPRPDRNVDRVILGDIAFRAWYPSFYPKDVLGIASGNAHGAKHGAAQDGGAGAKSTGGKWGGRGGRERGGHGLPAMLETLYVCPWCFKYAKEAAPWWEHMLVCDLRGYIPGARIYVHPKTKEEDGDWSVWEVDGDGNVLFCQNLSLFAKLFLDNKSVFFDVTGFNYFLLVYTPPAGADSHAKPCMFSAGQHIVGFFSKEKLSWDNNNLACILVFPPWQRRGLGALLMGVSYEISRREGVLGGPEKPISELGRRAYKRFWAGEIARWLLTVDRGISRSLSNDAKDADTEEGGAAEEAKPEEGQTEVEQEQMTDKSSLRQEIWEMESDGEATARGPAWDAGRKRKAPKKTPKHDVDVADGVLLVDVDYCSKATWIVADDCLAVLRDTGLVDEAQIKEDPNLRDAERGDDVPDEDDADGRPARRKPIRLDRQAVREWISTANVDLAMACDPGGFVEGYAVREEEPDDDE